MKQALFSGRCAFLWVLAFVIFCSAVTAQEVAGIRVDINSITGNTVNFDVVEFTDEGPAPATRQIDLISFGDGATATNAIVSRTATSFLGASAITGVFRATFSHVYPGPGTYNLRARDCCAGWPISNTAYYITGYYTGTSDTSVAIWNNQTATIAMAVPFAPQAALFCLATLLVGAGAWLLMKRPTPQLR